MKYLMPLLLIALFAACSRNSNETSSVLKEGIWRAQLDIKGTELPFNMITKKTGDSYSITLLNGPEEIILDSVVIQGDSVIINFPVYDTKIVAKISGDTLDGTRHYYNADGNFKQPFRAIYGLRHRFEPLKVSKVSVTGKWQAQFEDNGKPYPAVGIFEAGANGMLTATFLTETGDYRYLEGIEDEHTLKLSVFDGAHAFLFYAEKKGDSIINGTFYSGMSHKETWRAVRNDSGGLANAYELTFLNKGFKRIDFSFPNENGDTVSINDARYLGKPIIVQIMGTWCPNCKDETEYLSSIYSQYHKKGLEIISIAYEHAKDPIRVTNNLKRIKKQYGIEYEMLWGGSSNKKEAAKTLPMLNHVLSYPTTIFINKRGEIIKIHTGFTGPATGVEFTKVKFEFVSLIEKILAD